MKTIKILIKKIITFFKSLFKKKTNNPQLKSELPSEEPVKSEIKRLVYTKRTDK